MRPHKRYRAGIDIGGTFTDLVLVDDETGERAVGKVLTSPEDPSEAVEEGLVELLDHEGVAPKELKTIVHGTTLARPRPSAFCAPRCPSTSCAASTAG